MQVGDSYKIAKAYEFSQMARTGTKEQEATAIAAVEDTAADSADNNEGVPDQIYCLSAVRLSELSLQNAIGEPCGVFQTGEDIILTGRWSGKTQSDHVCLGMRIDSTRIQCVTSYSSNDFDTYINNGAALDGTGRFVLRLNKPQLGKGDYFITLSLKYVDFTGGDGTVLFLADRILSFKIDNMSRSPHHHACEIDIALVDQATAGR